MLPYSNITCSALPKMACTCECVRARVCVCARVWERVHIVKWQDETLGEAAHHVPRAAQVALFKQNPTLTLGHPFLSSETLGGSYCLCVVQRSKPTQRTAASHRIFEPKLLHAFPLACHLSSTLYRVPLRISRHQVLDLVTMLRMAVSGQDKNSSSQAWIVRINTPIWVLSSCSICLIISFFGWHCDPWKAKEGVSSVLYPRPQGSMAFILCPLVPCGDNCLHFGAYITYVSTCSPNVNRLGLK